MTGVAHANFEREPVAVCARPRRHILSQKKHVEKELGCRHRKFRAGLGLKKLRLALTTITRNLETLPVVLWSRRHFCVV
jgi:hypothetical protein